MGYSMDDARYWEEKDRRLAQDIADDRAYARSLAGRIDAAYRTARAMDGARIEDGMYTEAECAAAWETYRALQAEADAEQRAEAEARDAAFFAVWTPELTAERRAAWNARVTGGEFDIVVRGKKQPSPAQVAQAERAQGWTVEDLRKAVKHYQAK